MIKQFGFGKSSFAMRRLGFGLNAYDPAILFAGGQQGVWYDPSDLTTLYQDAAGTVPVIANGDPVGRVLDKSGNGNHAIQTVSAARPIYRTDGILHWLQFDGVDDYLYTLLSLTLGTNIMVCASVRKTGNTLGVIFSGNSSFSATQSLDNFLLRYPKGSGQYGAVFATVSGGFPTAYEGDQVTQGERLVVLTGAKVDAVNYLFVNTVEVASAQSSSTEFTTPSLYVGGHSQGYFSGEFYGGLIRAGNLTHRQKVEQYLAAKAGVTL